MKKLAFLMAVMMMFTLLLAGCNNTTTSSAPESKPAESSSAEGGEPSNSDDPYANIDLSKEETVVMYVTATEPNAIKEVMEAANEKIKAAINTTIDLYFIPSAERAQKYPLVMAGGGPRGARGNLGKAAAISPRLPCYRTGHCEIPTSLRSSE